MRPDALAHGVSREIPSGHWGPNHVRHTLQLRCTRESGFPARKCRPAATQRPRDPRATHSIAGEARKSTPVGRKYVIPVGAQRDHEPLVFILRPKLRPDIDTRTRADITWRHDPWACPCLQLHPCAHVGSTAFRRPHEPAGGMVQPRDAGEFTLCKEAGGQAPRLHAGSLQRARAQSSHAPAHRLPAPRSHATGGARKGPETKNASHARARERAR